MDTSESSTPPLDTPSESSTPPLDSLWDIFPFVVFRHLFRHFLTVADKLTLPPPLSTFLETRSAWLRDSHYVYYQCFTRLVPPGWYQDRRPLSPHRYLVRYHPDRVACHISYFCLATPVDPPTPEPHWRLHGWHAPSSSSSSSLLDLLAAFRRRAVPVAAPEEETVYHYAWHGRFTLHRRGRRLRWIDGALYRPKPSPASRPQVYDVPLPTREDSACWTCAYFWTCGRRSVPVVLRLDPRDRSVVVRHRVDPTWWIFTGELATQEACLTPLVLQVEEAGGTLRAKAMPPDGWRSGGIWRSSEWVLSAAGEHTAIQYDRYGDQLELCPLQNRFEIPELGLHAEKGLVNMRDYQKWLHLYRWEIPFVLKELKRHQKQPRSVEKKLKRD